MSNEIINAATPGSHYADEGYLGKSPNAGTTPDKSAKPSDYSAAHFWKRVDRSGGEDACWPWRSSINSGGYGQYRPLDGRKVVAHAVSYELTNGPIPVGLELDHLCRNRACVNPAHLEPVTHLENMRRGLHANKTHCPSGHPYDEENTYRARGRRYCRSCANGHRTVWAWNRKPVLS